MYYLLYYITYYVYLFVFILSEEAEGFNREFEQRAHVYRGGNGRGYYGGGGAAGGQYAIADAPRHYQQPSIEYYDHSQHPPSPQAG